MLAGLIAVVAVSADLAVANARYVITVPQALFEDEPEVLRIINEAERRNPSPGPFRVHRMPIWNPPRWFSDSSTDRVRDFVTWERGTIQPKYGITKGIEYTHTLGVAELFDYEWFFSGFPRTIREPVALALGAKAGQEVVYFPRRSFDMWNTRYFVLPVHPHGWMDEDRGYAAFLDETELIYPLLLQERGREAEQKAWVESHDYQIRRNRQVYPRAWVVHDSRPLPDLEGLTRLQQGGPMQEILYNDDRIWHDSTLTAFDPRRLVWIEKDKQLELRAFLSGKPPRPTETVKVSYPSPRARRARSEPRVRGNRRPRGHSLSRLETDDRWPARSNLQGQPPDARRGGSGWRPRLGLQLRTTLVPGWRNDHSRRPGSSRGLCRLLHLRPLVTAASAPYLGSDRKTTECLQRQYSWTVAEPGEEVRPPVRPVGGSPASRVRPQPAIRQWIPGQGR